MKKKYYFIFASTLILTNLITYLITYDSFKNLTVSFEVMRDSSDPKYMFEKEMGYCQPNLGTGSCSKLADESYIFIMNKWENYHKQEMDKFKNYATGVVNNAVNSTPINKGHYMNTRCRTDVTGNLVCDSFGY